MIKKLKDKTGSAMSLAIIIMLLIGISGVTITSMVNNQIKSIHKSSQNLDLKYNTEAAVEETIGDFISKIKAEGFKKEITEFNIIKLYVELANKLVHSNGIANAEINAILDKLSQGEMIDKEEMDKIKKELEKAINNEQGKSNPHADNLLKMAQKYTIFIDENLFNPNTGKLDLSMISYKKAQGFIKEIIFNISEQEFDDKEGKVYGNIAVSYRDTQQNRKGNNNIQGLYDSFNKYSNNITSIIKELTSASSESEINKWVTEKSQLVIDSIDSTDYTNVIEREKILIDTKIVENKKEVYYLDTDKVIKMYKATGSFSDEDINDLVKDRLDIIKLEIDMLIDWIKLMQNLNPDGTPGGTSNGRLIISVPKKIELKNDENIIIAKTSSVIYNSRNKDENDREGRVKLLEPTDSEYKSDLHRFEILKPPSTEVILDLDVRGNVEDYEISTKVEVKIDNISSDYRYNVEYEVKEWKKIN